MNQETTRLSHNINNPTKINGICKRDSFPDRVCNFLMLLDNSAGNICLSSFLTKDVGDSSVINSCLSIWWPCFRIPDGNICFTHTVSLMVRRRDNKHSSIPPINENMLNHLQQQLTPKKPSAIFTFSDQNPTGHFAISSSRFLEENHIPSSFNS